MKQLIRPLRVSALAVAVAETLNPNLTASSLVAVAFATRHVTSTSKINEFLVTMVCVVVKVREKERERRKFGEHGVVLSNNIRAFTMDELLFYVK
jgi:hypothetical protein